jgi:predicted aldo/keto reductase-like oxidoreductase
MAKLLTKKVFGKTGLLVSHLCFGTLSIGPYHSNLSVDEGAELLAFAYKQGINFWDTAELYETYPHINRALKLLNYPDDIIIASRSFARTYEEMKTSIDNCLNALELKTIAIFGLHEMSNQEDFEHSQGAFEALKEAKTEKKIQNIKISMHSIEAVNIASGNSWVDCIFPLYNIAGTGIPDGTAEEMTAAIKKASQKGKAVYAMKVLAGGHLSSKAEECINYVIKNTYVNSIAIGMDNTNEILLNIALFTGDTKTINRIKPCVASQKKTIQVDPWCEGCGECIKICPNNAITLEFSQAKINHDKCILCGYCASACKYFCLKVVNKR